MSSGTAVKGSVGEVADTCILHLHNEAVDTRRAVIRVTARNLCRSHAAFASLLVGADPRVAHVDLNDTRMLLETQVQPNEHAVLVVHLTSLHNDTTCIRLGETEFELDLTPLE